MICIIRILLVALLVHAAAPAQAADSTPKKPVADKRPVLIVSAAGSVLNQFPILKFVAIKQIDQIPESSQFTVLTFSDSGKVFAASQKLMNANEKNKKDAKYFFESVTPNGVSDPLPAFKMAVALKSDAIYYYGNGVSLSKDLAADVLELLGKQKVAIHVCAVKTEGSNLPALKKLAEATGGAYREVDDNVFKENP